MNASYQHEALDRAYTLSSMFDLLLTDHPFFDDKELIKKVETISYLLAELYQAIGSCEK